MAGGPEPSKCCLKCASCSADRTYSMSPARTSATNHSRSVTLRGASIACPTAARCTGLCRITMVSVTPTRTSGASPDTKKPLGPAPLLIGWRVAMGPLNPGLHDGCGRAGAGGGAKASVRESKKLLPGRQTNSRLHKSALLRHHKGGRMHIRLMLYNPK